MPITIKKNVMAYKDPTSNDYVGVDAVNDATLEERIGAVETALPDKYEKPANGIPASDIASGVIPDVSGKTDQGAVATPYASLTWPVTAGKYCFYNGYVYRAKQDIATSESWTAAHWDQVVLGDEVSDVKTAIDGVEDKLLFKDSPANLYEPQNVADILDGYILRNGVPQTQYGSKYFVSDYVPVVGGKTITFSYAVWGTDPDKEWRAAEYDSSKNYIRYIQNTEHELSSNAAYIRFTVRKGNDTAATRLAYVNANLTITDGESGKATPYIDMSENAYMSESSVRKTDKYFVDASNDEILIMWKMQGANNKDVGVKMKTFNDNNMFSFSSFGTATNKTEFVGNKPSNYVQLMSTGEDHFSPFRLRAVNNGDGDYPDTSIYTGGFHKKDSMNTARRISLDMYFDGRKIQGFVGYCNTIDIVEVHRIQAENTFKTSGEGREVIEQILKLHFENGEIKVSTDVIALESVTISTWYFIQGHHKANGLGSNGIRYIGSNAQRGIVSMDAASNSGDKYGKTMRMLSDVLQAELTMDGYDIGRGDFNEQSFSCDVRAYDGYSKCYFSAIRASTNPVALDAGGMISARGSYRFGLFE